MGNEQQKEKNEESNSKPAVKKKGGMFQISASEGLGLSRLNDRIFSDDPVEELEEFEEKGVIFWGKTDVLEFLNQIDYEDLFTYLDKVEKGEDLLGLQFDDPSFIKWSEELLEPSDEKRRLNVFFVYLLHIKNCQNPKEPEENVRCFTLKFHRVFRKILKVIGGNTDFEVQRMESLVRSLCYHEEIERIFLNEDEMMSSLNDTGTESKKKKIISMMDEEEEEKPPPPPKAPPTNQKVEVQLILKEPMEIDLRDQLLKLLKSERGIEPLCEEIHKPTLLTLANRASYGYLSPAIFIPPFLLEWSPEELVIPRRISQNVVRESVYRISLDTDPVVMTVDLQNKTKKIAKTIERWNHYHHFSLQKVPEIVNQLLMDELASDFEKKKQKRSTPEEFVANLCSEMGCFRLSSSDETTTTINSFGDRPVIRKFLDRITSPGDQVKKDGFFFEASKEFENEYKLEEISMSKISWERMHHHGGGGGLGIRFLKHRELDDFVAHCFKVSNNNSHQKFEDEFRLLKSFDRAFWMRYVCDSDNEKWKHSSKSTGCPFSSPL